MPRNRRGDRDDDKGRRGGRGRERDGTVCGAERQHDDCDLQLFDQDALEDECERGTARPPRLLDLRDVLRVLVAFRLAARRPQDRLLQPLEAEEEQEDAHDEPQVAERNALERRSEHGDRGGCDRGESAAALSAGRQPRVNPTASTIVAASTSSTAHARNADAKAKTAEATYE